MGTAQHQWQPAYLGIISICVVASNLWLWLFADFPSPDFALDANVFPQAHQRYCRMDLCPGFWDCQARPAEQAPPLDLVYNPH